MSRKDRQPRTRETKEERIARDRQTSAEALAKAGRDAANQRTRRFLLIGGGVALGAALVAGAGILVSKQSAPALNSGGDEESKRIADLDQKAKVNPLKVLSESAPEIAEIAVDNFSSETGRKRVEPKKTISFYSHSKEFALAVNKTNPCPTLKVDGSLIGVTNRETGDIFINLEALIAENLRVGSGTEDLARFVYEVVQHEGGHATSAKAILRPEFATYLSIKYSLDGYYAYGLSTRLQKPDGCSLTLSHMTLLEELVVQDQAERGIRKISNNRPYRPRGYSHIMPDFRSTITSQYFPSDPEKLFKIQGDSDPASFFEEIGRRARAKYQNTGLSDGAIGAQVVHPLILRYVK